MSCGLDTVQVQPCASGVYTNNQCCSYTCDIECSDGFKENTCNCECQSPSLGLDSFDNADLEPPRLP